MLCALNFNLLASSYAAGTVRYRCVKTVRLEGDRSGELVLLQGKSVLWHTEALHTFLGVLFAGNWLNWKEFREACSWVWLPRKDKVHLYEVVAKLSFCHSAHTEMNNVNIGKGKGTVVEWIASSSAATMLWRKTAWLGKRVLTLRLQVLNRDFKGSWRPPSKSFINLK